MQHGRSIELIPADLSRLDAARLYELKAVTPATLSQYDVLGGRCAVCKHEGRIDRNELTRHWPGISLMALEQRLLCRHCRNKDKNKFLISRLPRD